MVTITPSERFTPYSPVVPTTVFAVGFPILDNADVVLMHNGSVVAGAIVSGTYAEGVSTNAIITAPVGLVGAVQVVGQRVPQRTSQYAAGKPLPISDHNYALNRVEMEIQETRRETNRSLKLPVGDKPADFPAKTVRAGKYLSFDTGGNPVSVTDVHEVATVAAIASEIVTVANISGAVVAVKDNATNINKVAAIDAAVSAVGAVADDIPTVVIMRPEIQAVIADKANIGTVASHITNVDKVAAIDQAVTKVAAIDAAVSTVSGISADVTKVSSIAPAVSAVADDRLTIAAVAGNKPNIDAVAVNKPNIDAAVANATNINAAVANTTNINAVAANGADIDIVAANMTKVDTVAGIAPHVVTVAAIAPEVAAVGAVASSVPVVAAIDDKVAAVAENAANVTAVANNKANIDAVAGNKTNIDAVKNNATNINAVAADKANIDTVANSKTDIGTVAANIAAVNNASTNMPAIIAAPTKAQEAAQSAADAAESKRLAELVTALMKGGAIGQLLIKTGNGDYEYGWADPSAGGDMFKLNYDPRGINADAFSMANMAESAAAKIMTASERTKLGGIAANATANTGTVTSVAVAVPTGFTVTPAITTSGTITIGHATGYQAYTTAEANKLAGINLALYQTLALKGLANGYAGLDPAGKVPTTQLPDTVLGAVRYIGVWDASTNTPAIPAASAGNKGWYYMVSVTGTTNIDGNGEWVVGDWIVSNGTRWDRVKNVDAVISVADLRGAITAAALRIALSINNVANKTEAQMVASGAIADALGGKVSKSGDTMTGALIAPGVETTNGSLTIKNDGYSHLWFRNAAGTEKAVIFCNNAGENATFRVNGVHHFSFQANGSFVAPQNIAAYSDSRLKSEVETISDALAIIKNLRGTRYIKGGVKQIGLIAQEVREVVPEAVFENTDENDQFIKAGHETGTLSVAADNTLLAVVIEAVKELAAEVDYLRGRLK